MEYCFNYYKSYKAQNQSSYPYTGVKSSTCNYKAASGLVNTIGYGYATQNDPTSIINALKIQPLSVAVAAEKSDFQLYSSGILSGSTCGTALFFSQAMALTVLASHTGSSRIHGAPLGESRDTSESSEIPPLGPLESAESISTLYTRSWHERCRHHDSLAFYNLS